MSQTKHDLTTAPLLIVASPSAPVSVSVVAGDVVYYYSTSAVSSSTKDGTIDPAGTSGPHSVVLTSTKWVASNRSSAISQGPTGVSVDPLQRTRGLPGLATPTPPDGWASPSTLTPPANQASFGRFTVTAPVTVSTGAFLVTTAGGLGEHFCVGIYQAPEEGGLTRIATTGAFTSDTDELSRIPFTLSAPVQLIPGVVYFSALASSDTTAALTSCRLAASLSSSFILADSATATHDAVSIALFKSSAYPLPSTLAAGAALPAIESPFILFDVS